MSRRLHSVMETPSITAPSHLLTALDMVVSFAKGRITFEQYKAQLDMWWQEHKDVWQENDLAELFRLISLTD